jgi:hypothetical protein
VQIRKPSHKHVRADKWVSILIPIFFFCEFINTHRWPLSAVDHYLNLFPKRSAIYYIRPCKDSWPSRVCPQSISSYCLYLYCNLAIMIWISFNL